MKKTFFRLLVLILIGGGAYAYVTSKKRAQTPYLTERVRVTDLKQSVSASGKVESASEVLLSFEQSGRVSSLAAIKGTYAEAGQILITLNQSSARSRFEELDAALTAAQAEYNKLIAGATPEERRLAEVSVENARDALTQTRVQATADTARADQAVREAEAVRDAARTSRDQDVIVKLDAARSAVDTAEKKARSALNTLEEIYDTNDTFQNFISIQNSQTATDASNQKSNADAAWERFSSSVSTWRIDPTETNTAVRFPAMIRELETTRTAVNTTSVALNDAIVSSSAPKTLTTYQSDVLVAWTDLNAAIDGLTDAATALAQARRNGDATVALKESALASAETSRASTAASSEKATRAAEAELRRAEAEYQKLVAVARQEERELVQAKIVQAESSLASAQAVLDHTTLISPIAGTITDVNVKTGETVSPGQTVVRMLSAHNLEITVQTPETDIPKLSVGDSADITLDAFNNDRAFPGTVSFINPAETLVEGVVYYEVTVAFDETEEGIKPGMSANVTVHTNARPGALAVPLRAIKDKNGTTTVEVLNPGGTTESRQVTTGLRADDGLIEITEGLQEGEEVVVGIKKK